MFINYNDVILCVWRVIRWTGNRNGVFSSLPDSGLLFVSGFTFYSFLTVFSFFQHRSADFFSSPSMHYSETSRPALLSFLSTHSKIISTILSFYLQGFQTVLIKKRLFLCLVRNKIIWPINVRQIIK